MPFIRIMTKIVSSLYRTMAWKPIGCDRSHSSSIANGLARALADIPSLYVAVRPFPDDSFDDHLLAVHNFTTINDFDAIALCIFSHVNHHTNAFVAGSQITTKARNGARNLLRLPHRTPTRHELYCTLLVRPQKSPTVGT